MFCCFYNKMSYFYCVLKAISSQDCFPVSCFPFTCPGLCFSFLFLTFLLSSVPTVYSHDRYFTGTVTQCRGSGVSGRLPKHILPPKRPSGGSITAWGTKTLEGRDFCTPKEGTEVTSVWRNSVLLPPGRNLNSVCGSICPFLLWHGVSLSLSLSFSHSLSLSLYDSSLVFLCCFIINFSLCLSLPSLSLSLSLWFFSCLSLLLYLHASCDVLSSQFLFMWNASLYFKVDFKQKYISSWVDESKKVCLTLPWEVGTF